MRVIPMIGLLAALALAFTLSISLGPVQIPPLTVWQIVAHHATGIGDSAGWTPIQDNIVWERRLPRTLLGILVGAGLTVTGVVTQVLVRNPLADPYVLGISQGASVGAVASIVLGVGAFGVSSTAGAAFVGAAGSFALVYAFARRGGSMAPLRLVLAGVAVGFAFNGVAHFLVLRADTPGETNTALFWLLGSLAKASWAQLALPAAVLAAGTVTLIGRVRALNALMTGDETAASLGVGVERLRRQLLALASLLTGVMVAVSGSIGTAASSSGARTRSCWRAAAATLASGPSASRPPAGGWPVPPRATTRPDRTGRSTVTTTRSGRPQPW